MCASWWSECWLRPHGGLVSVVREGPTSWPFSSKVRVFLDGVVLRRVRVVVLADQMSVLRVPLDVIGVCAGGAPMGGRGWVLDILRMVGMEGPS